MVNLDASPDIRSHPDEPGQSFRLPPAVASDYQFAHGHAVMMTIIVDLKPESAWADWRWRWGSLGAMGW